MKWTRSHTLALAVIILALLVIAIALPPQLSRIEPQIWWLILMGLLAAFVVISGHGITGRWSGALIDDQNCMSLSRFQMILWTILLLSAFLMAALINMGVEQHAATALDVKLEPELWMLMGISTTSLVGSPLILSSKANQTPNAKEVEHTFELLKQQDGTGSAPSHKGMLYANQNAADARWSDLLTGEEVGNAAHLDLTRVQMLFFTFVVVLAYGAMLFSAFGTVDTIRHGMTALPPLSDSIVAPIGISHTGYLVAKAVPHSLAPQSTPQATNSQAALPLTDDHPAMG